MVVQGEEAGTATASGATPTKAIGWRSPLWIEINRPVLGRIYGHLSRLGNQQRMSVWLRLGHKRAGPPAGSLDGQPNQGSSGDQAR